MTARRTGGFTIIEVVLALTIGAMVLTVLGELLGAAVTASRRMERVRASLDSASVGTAWLRMAFRNAEAGQHGDVEFDGRENGVRFSTRTPGPGGWHAPDVVSIGLRDSAVVMESRRLGALRLITGVRTLSLDYLERLGADSPWLPAYMSPALPALAVRVRVERASGTDTLVFRTGITN